MTPRSSTTALCRPTRSESPTLATRTARIRAISIAIPKPISIAVPPRQSTASPTKNPNPETDDRKFGIDRAGDAGDDGRQGLLASAMRGTDEHRRYVG